MEGEEEVIVMANMNEDVLAKDIDQFCQEMCLVDALLLYTDCLLIQLTKEVVKPSIVSFDCQHY